ncbi:hypothetical protein GTW66_10290, partial [Streptomyces sp. SID5473]|uniref:hypothetical protein n=1 Tax=Streptomyces sp. SID5473 TaxID=2690299 RepID=UPI00141CC6EE
MPSPVPADRPIPVHRAHPDPGRRRAPRTTRTTTRQEPSVSFLSPSRRAALRAFAGLGTLVLGAS